jgi:hypothetical protein
MPSASLPTIDERVVSELPPTDGLRLRASPSVVGSALHRCKALISGLTSRSHSRGLGLSLGRRAAKGAAPSTIVEDGLVAEWRLDEGSGQTITDCTGNGHNGVLGSPPAWTRSIPPGRHRG